MAITVNGKRIYGLTEEDLEYIKAHSEDKAADIAAALGKNYRRVAEVIKAANLRPRYTKTKIAPSDLPAYEADLKNPKLSHAKLAFKWRVTPEAIGSARKRRGLGVWRTNHNTILELRVQGVLDGLDIAYLKQKRIGRWSIDFYLGHGICVDAHGQWAHNKPEVQERDKRKRQELLAAGYKYLAIYEQEFTHPNSITTKLAQFYWASLGSNPSTKYFVNPEAQGCGHKAANGEPPRGQSRAKPPLEEGVETNCKLENELPVEARSPSQRVKI